MRRAIAEPFLLWASWHSFRPQGFPILTYHSVADVEGADVETVRPASFEGQLAWLARHGIMGATVSELVDSMASEEQSSAAVALSFDDGYLDNYQTALPLLSAYGMRATFYVVAAYVGTTSSWNPVDYIGHRPLLGRPEIEALARHNMEIGSHGLSHVDLTELTEAQLDEELVRSRRILQELAGSAVRGLAAPFGRSSPLVESRAARTGYTHLVRGGRFIANRQDTPPHELCRITVARDDSMREFAKKVSGAYRWLSLWQRT
jgi:peptidoglycan/xylan/chitin deacetylase (PgdA/CDA1 family)